MNDKLKAVENHGLKASQKLVESMMSEKAQNKTKRCKIGVFSQNKFDGVETPGTKMQKVDDAVTRNHDQKKCQMCRQALSREVIWQQNWHT